MRIELNQVSVDQFRQGLPTLLRNSFGHTAAQHLLALPRLLLLLDGFDELAGFSSLETNIYRLLVAPLDATSGRIKVIVSCRTRHLTEVRQRQLFSKPDGTQILRRYVAPFALSQMQQYITKRTQNARDEQTTLLLPASEYQDELQNPLISLTCCGRRLCCDYLWKLCRDFGCNKRQNPSRITSMAVSPSLASPNAR